MCAGEVAAVHPSFMQYYREAEVLPPQFAITHQLIYMSQFAVDELKKLSDTGVYETLKLVDIVDGSREVIGLVL